MAQKLSNQQEFFQNEDEIDLSQTYGLNIDDIDKLLDLSKNTREKVSDECEYFSDEETIIIEEKYDDDLNSKDIIKKIQNYGLRRRNVQATAASSADPGDRNNIQVINNKTTLNPYKGLIKSKSIQNFNQKNRQQYKKLMRIIQNRRAREKKQLEIRNMKMKVIAVKVMYFLGTKALKLYLTTNCAPMLFSFFLSPHKIFNPTTLEGFLTIFEATGLIPIHLLHQIKDVVNNVKFEFGNYIDENKLNDKWQNFLKFPTKANFEPLLGAWHSYTEFDGENILNVALNSKDDNGLKAILSKIKQGKKFIDSLLGTTPTETEQSDSTSTATETEKTPEDTLNEFARLLDKNPLLSENKPSLINLGRVISGINSINSNYIGIFLNMGSDSLDITSEIYKLQLLDTPTKERPDRFLKRKMKGNLMNIFSSTQLATYLNNYLPQPMYLFSAPTGSDNDDMTLLGSIKGLANMVFRPPNSGSIVTSIGLTFVDSIFKIEDDDISETAEQKKKTQFEERVNLRAEMYSQKFTKKQIDKAISEKYSNQPDKYKSLLFNELHKIFVKKDIKSIQKFTAFCFGGIVATEIVTAFSGSILQQDIDGISRNYATLSSLLYNLREKAGKAILFTTLMVKQIKEKGLLGIRTGEIYQEIFKIEMAEMATGKGQKIFGIPKLYIIEHINMYIRSLITEIQAIISDVIKTVNIYFNEFNNKSAIFNAIFGKKISIILVKYTLLIFEFSSNLYLSAISNQGVRQVQRGVMKLNPDTVIKSLSFEKFVDIMAYVNKNSISISKYLYSNKEDDTIDLIDSVTTAAYSATDKESMGVIGSVVSIQDGDVTDNTEPLEDEGNWFWQKFIGYTLNYMTMREVSQEDYFSKRREYYRNYGKNQNNQVIVSNDPLSGRAYVIPSATLKKPTNADTYSRDSVILLFIEKFISDYQSNPDISVKVKQDLNRDKVLIDRLKSSSSTPGSREIKLEDLNIIKKYRAQFLQYIQEPNKNINPIFTDFIKSLSLGSESESFLENLDTLVIYPYNIDPTQLLNFIRTEQLLRYKYNRHFDECDEIIIPDSYLLGDTVDDGEVDLCDFNKMNSETQKSLKDLSSFIKDMLYIRRANNGYMSKSIVISLANCPETQIDEIKNKLKEYCHIGNKNVDKTYDALFNKKVTFKNSDTIKPNKDKNIKRLLLSKDDNLHSLDPIEIAKFVYDNKGSERNLNENTKFYRPKTVKFWDSLSARYFTKTIYIPEVYGDYYVPSDSDMRNFLLSKFSMLKTELSSLEQHSNPDLQMYISSIEKLLNNYLVRLNSDAEDFGIDDMKKIYEYLGNVIPRIEKDILLIKTQQKDLASGSKMIKNEEFIGAFNPILQLLDDPNLIINKNRQEELLKERKSQRELIEFFDKDKRKKMLVPILTELSEELGKDFVPNDSIDIFTLLPILFNPRAVDFINQQADKSNDYSKLREILEAITKELLELGKYSKKNGPGVKLYESLKSKVVNQKKFTSSGHMYIRDGLSKFLYKSSIDNMMYEYINQDGNNIELSWIDDDNSFIFNHMQKLFFQNRESVCEKDCRDYFQEHFSAIRHIDNFIDEKGKLKKFNSKSKNDESNIYVYSGNNIVLRRFNIKLLEDMTEFSFSQAQKHFITLLEHSRIAYSTKDWSTEYYTVLLKAMGLSSWTRGHLSNSIRFNCSLYEILWRPTVYNKTGYEEKLEKLKDTDICTGAKYENADINTIPMPPPEKKSNDQEFLDWESSKRSTEWLAKLKSNSILVNLPEETKSQIMGIIDKIESNKNACIAGQQECDKVKLQDDYLKLYGLVKESFKITIVSMKDEFSESFIRRYKQYNNNRKSLEGNIAAVIRDFKDKLDQFEEDIKFRNRQKSSADEQVRSTGNIPTFTDFRTPGSGETSQGTSSSSASGTRGGPMEQNRNTEGQEVSMSTQEGVQGNVERTTEEQQQALNEALDEAVQEAEATINDLDQTNAQAEDIIESLLQELQNMFSGLDDFFSKSSGLGLKERGNNPFESATGPEMDSMDNTDEFGTPENNLRECKARTTWWSAGSNYDPEYSHIVTHSNAFPSLNKKKEKQFIRDNCLVESKLRGIDEIITSKQRKILPAIRDGVVKIVNTVMYWIYFLSDKIGLACNTGLCGAAGVLWNRFIDNCRKQHNMLNNFLNFEVVHSVNFMSMSYQTRYLYENIFNIQANMSELAIGNYFKYQNNIFKVNKKNQNGEFTEIELIINNSENKVLKYDKSKNKFFEEKGKYEIDVGNTEWGRFISVPDPDSPLEEYSIKYILGEEDNTNMPPLSEKEKNKRRLLLASLYSIIGSSEYEDYAKITGEGLVENWRFYSLGDQGNNRMELLSSENSFNTKLLKKLWNVSNLPELRRNTRVSHSKPERATSFENIRDRKNYQSWGDITDQAFDPETGLMDLQGMNEALLKIKNILGEDINSFSSFNIKSLADLKNIINHPMAQSRLATRKKAQIMEIASKIPGMTRFLFGDNSMEAYILKKISESNSGQEESNKLSSDDYMYVENLLLASDNYDYFRDNIGIYMTVKAGVGFVEWIIIGIKTVLTPLKYVPGIGPVIEGIIDTLKVLQQPLNFVKNLPLYSENKLLDKYACEEVYLKITKKHLTLANNFFDKLKAKLLRNCGPYGIDTSFLDNVIDPPIFVENQKDVAPFARKDFPVSIFSLYQEENPEQIKQFIDNLIDKYEINKQAKIKKLSEDIKTLEDDDIDPEQTEIKEEEKKNLEDQLKILKDQTLEKIIYDNYNYIFSEFKVNAEDILRSDNHDLIFNLLTTNLNIIDKDLLTSLVESDLVFKQFLKRKNPLWETDFDEYTKDENQIKDIKSIKSICSSNYDSRYSHICSEYNNVRIKLLRHLTGSKMNLVRNKMLTDIFTREDANFKKITRLKTQSKDYYYDKLYIKTKDERGREVYKKCSKNQLANGEIVYLKDEPDIDNYLEKVIYNVVPTNYIEQFVGYGNSKYKLKDRTDNYYAQLEINPNAKNRVYFSTLSTKKDKTGTLISSIGDVNKKIIDSIIDDLDENSETFRQLPRKEKENIFIELYIEANLKGSKFDRYKSFVMIKYKDYLSENVATTTILKKILCISEHRDNYILENKDNHEIVGWLYDIKKLLWQVKDDSEYNSLLDAKIISNSNEQCEGHRRYLKYMDEGNFKDYNCQTTFFETNLIADSIFGYVYRDHLPNLEKRNVLGELATKLMPIEPITYHSSQLLDISDDNIVKIFNLQEYKNPIELSRNIQQKRRELKDFFASKGKFIYRKPIHKHHTQEEYDIISKQDGFEHISGPDDNGFYKYYINAPEHEGKYNLELTTLNQEYDATGVEEQTDYGWVKSTPELVFPNFVKVAYEDDQSPPDYPDSGTQTPSNLVENQKPISQIYPAKLPEMLNNIKTENGKNKYVPVVFVRCSSNKQVEKVLNEKKNKNEHFEKDTFNFIESDIDDNNEIVENTNGIDDMKQPLLRDVEYVSTEPEIDTSSSLSVSVDNTEFRVKFREYGDYYEFDNSDDLITWWKKKKNSLWEWAKQKGRTLAQKMGLITPNAKNLYNKKGELTIGTGTIFTDDIIRDTVDEYKKQVPLSSKGGKFRLYKKMKIKKYKVKNIDNRKVLGLESSSPWADILYIDRDLFDRKITGEETDKNKGTGTEGSLLESVLKYKYKLSEDGKKIYICKDALESLSTAQLQKLFSRHLASSEIETDSDSNGTPGNYKINMQLIEE